MLKEQYNYKEVKEPTTDINPQITQPLDVLYWMK